MLTQAQEYYRFNFSIYYLLRTCNKKKISLDSTSNNYIAIGQIKKKKKLLHLACTGTNEIFYIQHINYILYLIVQSNFDDIKDMIEKLRSWNFYF